ncbi:MAG: AAA family ATPase [Candidatus Brocadia sp.]|nr:MAG: AAA family ATPase [Candidatus Brocadia sp.]
MNKTEILNNLNIEGFYKSFIPSLKTSGKADVIGLCPFHDDHNPSLSVNIETGLFRCFSCDAKGDIFTFYQRLKDVDFQTALKEMGEIAGVAESGIKPKVVAKFEYKDEAGNLLYAKERIEPGRNGRSKEFVFKHLEGNTWASGRGCDSVLYNLPQVVKAKYCFIVEGEAKADLLNSWGLVATCLDSGANSNFKNEHIEILSKKEKVVILPDNDRPGRKQASGIANALHGKVKEIKVVELPGLQEAGDIVDWAGIPGNSQARLIELAKATPAWTPTADNKDTEGGFDLTKALRIGAELQVLDLPISWAVKGLVPQQAITLLSARGGMGKTILSISIADAITKGIPFLGLETTEMPVVYIDFENSLPTLCERVKRIDAKHVLFWHGTNEIKPPRLDSKEYEFFKKLPPGALLIFDTLRASQSRDENDSQHMAMIMQRFKELRNLGFTILLLHHTSKSNDRIYKGSTAIFDLCDHSLSLHKVKKGCHTPEENETNDDDDNYCYRLGTQDKTRYEPFSIFLEFDTERGCFAIAPDPETETLEEIRGLLVGKELLKTNDIFELVRDELGIKYKGKVIRMLKKGEGKYWISESLGKGKPTYYRVAEPNQSGSLPYIYSDCQTTHKLTGLPASDHLPQKRLDSPDLTDWSGSLSKSQTGQTTSKVTGLTHVDRSGVSQTGQTGQTDTVSEDKNDSQNNTAGKGGNSHEKEVRNEPKNVSVEPINLDEMEVVL